MLRFYWYRIPQRVLRGQKRSHHYCGLCSTKCGSRTKTAFRRGKITLYAYLISKDNLTLFQVGAAFPIEVSHLTQTTYGATFILKCPALCYIKLRSSLTLQNTYYSDICVFHVLRTGTNALELYNSKPLLTINWSLKKWPETLKKLWRLWPGGVTLN